MRAWRTDDIRADRYDRRVQLRDLVLLLSDSLTERGVGQWLHARTEEPSLSQAQGGPRRAPVRRHRSGGDPGQVRRAGLMDRDKKREKDRDHYERNREAILERNRDYYKRNREQVREQRRRPILSTPTAASRANVPTSASANFRAPPRESSRELVFGKQRGNLLVVVDLLTAQF